MRPRIAQQVVRGCICACGAVSPLDGQFRSLILPFVNAEIMGMFLSFVSDSFPDDHCVFCLDGAGWHKAKDLEVPANMSLIFLPPYSPELNPVEHIWEYTRGNDFRNRACKSMDEVTDILCESLSHLANSPDLVRSMTCFDWINTL